MTCSRMKEIIYLACIIIVIYKYHWLELQNLANLNLLCNFQKPGQDDEHSHSSQKEKEVSISTGNVSSLVHNKRTDLSSL